MKILICYHSQTGNTKKVAQAMQEALESEDVVLLPAAEVTQTSLKEYDLILMGSGVYAGTVGTSIKALMKKATELPSRFAFFITHANPDPAMYQDAFKLVRKGIEKAGSQVVGEFDCRGENLVTTEEQLQKLLESLSSEEREVAQVRMEGTRGHPDDEDLANAQEFAKSLIG